MYRVSAARALKHAPIEVAAEILDSAPASGCFALDTHGEHPSRFGAAIDRQCEQVEGFPDPVLRASIAKFACLRLRFQIGER